MVGGVVVFFFYFEFLITSLYSSSQLFFNPSSIDVREKEKKETVQADADGPRVVNHCVAGRRVDSIAKKKLKAYQSVADRRDETDWYYPLYTRGDLRASQYIKFIRLLFFLYFHRSDNRVDIQHSSAIRLLEIKPRKREKNDTKRGRKHKVGYKQKLI